MFIRKITTLFILLLIPGILVSQNKKSQDSDIFFKNEKSLGINLYSSGFGGSYRYTKRINYFNKRNFEVEINTLKHPKEIKTSNPTLGNGGKYVFGKLNETINTRWGYGKQKELFTRKYEGSVTIKFHYLYGLDILLQKPIYYEILNPIQEGFAITEEKFEDSYTTDQIRGKASFSKGLDEITVTPGAFGKLSFSFEFLTKKDYTHNLEGGIICDAFPWEIEMMALTSNQQFFYSLFISYRIGIIVDARKSRRKKKREKSID